MAWIQLAAAAIAVVGQLAQGQQAKQAANYNAAIAEQNADEAERAGAERENIARQNSAQMLSSQRVAMLQNGVDPAAGTALVGAEQQTRDAELDALQLRYEGLMQARDLRMQAGAERYRGKAAKRNSLFSAAGSLMSSAGGYLSSSGFGAKGPGYSGTQMPAPVSTRNIPRG
jgi:hypothetical protein